MGGGVPFATIFWASRSAYGMTGWAVSYELGIAM